MKGFILGNVVGAMTAGAIVLLAIISPDTTKAEKLAELTRNGDVGAAFIEYMRAPLQMKAKSWPYQ